jgi:hypothetical protein
MNNAKETMTQHQKLRAAAQQEPAVYTPDCLDPEALIDLIEQGADTPAAAQRMAHIVTCAYCRREFEEMERMLAVAAQARALQVEAEKPPASATAPEAAGVTLHPERRLPFWQRLLAPSYGLCLGSAAAAGLLVYALARPPVSPTAPTQDEAAFQQRYARMLNQQNQILAGQKALIQQTAQRLTTAQRENTALQQANASLRQRETKQRAAAQRQEAQAAQLKQEIARLQRHGEWTGKGTPVVLADSRLVAQAEERGLRVPGLEVPASVRGGGGETPAIKLIRPVDAFVQEARPLLRWKPLAGVTDYTVTVFNRTFDKVAEKKVSGTGWRIERLLPPGESAVYSWKVTGRKDGEEVSSPSVYFQIVDAKRGAALRQAQLALGVRYAQAGLAEEAEKVFRAVLDADPANRAAQKLLHDLQTGRHGRAAP